MEDDKVIEMILEDIREIKGDVKDLLKFKYTLLGMVTLGSVIVSFLVTVALK